MNRFVLCFVNMLVFGFGVNTSIIHTNLDKSVEDFKTVDLSGMFNYPPDEKRELKMDYRRKYQLRFDPASLKQSPSLPIPNFPTNDGEFNIDDLAAQLPNSIPPGFPALPANFPQSIPNAAPNGINNNFPTSPITPGTFNNNTLPSPQTNPISPPNVNNNFIPPPPNFFANQTNSLPSNPNQFTTINPNIGFQTPVPSFLPNLNPIPTLQNALAINSAIQPLAAIIPQSQPAFATNIARPVKKPQPTPTFVKRPESSRGFLNLFDVIKFKNEPCSGSLNRIRWINGTCFYKSECIERGGVIAGSCADGYGVCCVFKYGCGSETQEEISYLESPNYPLATSQPLTCGFVLHLQPGIQQVRIDLLFFELRQPVLGNCVDDQFVVSGQNKNFLVPIICGINSGQHMYIDVDTAPERQLQISVVGRSAAPRGFSIRIIQLRYYLAPRYCLQYFTEPTGYIKSFNYDNVGNIVEGRMASYLNNLNYAICIERMPDKCSITYTNQVAEGELPFQLINVNEQMVPLVPPGLAGVDVFNCPDDFIAVNSVHLCGSKLNDGSVSQNFNENAPVTEYGAGPIVIPFQSDEAVVGRGFKLIYYQEACD
ncbi:uncharacterized protein LOC119650976 [Hermetia illucens]|uniref:uncharacterized protein LOC119650976 n=1 Tax=Hermetia illucens TaxID=343691 RepID=UPI0018CC008B|nr:uncharacterized protein LOC119650976 [Hermetia illucens]